MSRRQILFAVEVEIGGDDKDGGGRCRDIHRRWNEETRFVVEQDGDVVGIGVGSCDVGAVGAIETRSDEWTRARPDRENGARCKTRSRTRRVLKSYVGS